MEIFVYKAHDRVIHTHDSMTTLRERVTKPVSEGDRVLSGYVRSFAKTFTFIKSIAKMNEFYWNSTSYPNDQLSRATRETLLELIHEMRRKEGPGWVKERGAIRKVGKKNPSGCMRSHMRPRPRHVPRRYHP